MSDPAPDHDPADPRFTAVNEEVPIEPVTTIPDEPVAPPLGAPSEPAAAEGLLGGMIPEDRPELLVAAAFAGGAVSAILLRTLVRR